MKVKKQFSYVIKIKYQDTISCIQTKMILASTYVNKSEKIGLVEKRYKTYLLENCQNKNYLLSLFAQLIDLNWFMNMRINTNYPFTLTRVWDGWVCDEKYKNQVCSQNMKL